MNCEYCQSPVHIWFQCPKKPDGWKPARLARVRISTEASDSALNTPKSDVSASPPRHREVHTQSPARLAKKSTAARSERAEAAGGLQTTHSPNGAPIDERLKRRKAKQQVPSMDDQPSQALPVDTNSTPDLQPVSTDSSGPDGFEVTPQLGAKFDKKTWQREYMKPYLRKYREDVKAGKRVPKKRER